MSNPIILDALKEIQKSNSDGLLLPEDVVTAARDENSPLHDRFDWDDSAAARKYRIIQARELIASVEIVTDGPRERFTPAFVSLMPDRKDGGGYRAIKEVLSSKRLKKEMIRTALIELNGVRQRYDRLSELAGVFREIRRLEKSLSRRRAARR
jgi:hypothetical protein